MITKELGHCFDEDKEMWSDRTWDNRPQLELSEVVEQGFACIVSVHRTSSCATQRAQSNQSLQTNVGSQVLRYFDV